MTVGLRTSLADPVPPGHRSFAPQAGPIRVMVIDDSLTVRTIFSRMIGGEADLAVVAQAASAEEGLRLLRMQKVDIILLDLEMPGMGGLEALPQLLAIAAGAHVLVVSSLTTDGAEATLQALQIGAADTMLKPHPGGFNADYRDNLLGKVRALGRKSRPRSIHASPAPSARARPARPKPPKVVAIGASTGGIYALGLFLRSLPARFDLPILITQHLPETFMPVFARQMETAAQREAVLADEGVAVQPNRIVIAPGHGHMIVRRRDAGEIVTGLAHHAVKTGCRPSVDPMFETLADVYEGHVAAVLLSGMGRDGTEGAHRIAAAGGGIYAQDETSCAVWGMPRGVTEAGLVHASGPPEALASKIIASVGTSAWR